MYNLATKRGHEKVPQYETMMWLTHFDSSPDAAAAADCPVCPPYYTICQFVAMFNLCYDMRTTLHRGLEKSVVREQLKR